MKLVIATGNPGKIAEIHHKLKDIPGLELVPRSFFPNLPEPREDGATFRENAHIKALNTARRTGLPSMADDSGLEIDALNGRPGVHSARYGGAGATDEIRNRMILEEMRGIALPMRRARFVCVIAIAFPDGTVHEAQGSCEGVIGFEPRGCGGFGYDPIFLIPDTGLTMAEIPLDEKNRISHRAKALEEARNILLRLSAPRGQGTPQ